MDALQNPGVTCQANAQGRPHTSPLVNEPDLAYIAESFVGRRLKPYLIANGLEPSKRYSLEDLADKMLDLNPDIPNPVIAAFRAVGADPVLGIDYAFAALRQRYYGLSSPEQVSQFFGVNDISSFVTTPIYSNTDGNTLGEEYHELYSLVAGKARAEGLKIRLNHTTEPVEITALGTRFRIPKKTQEKYLSLFGFQEFDTDQAEYIVTQIEHPDSTVNGSKIKTPGLVIFTRGKIITRIKPNLVFNGRVLRGVRGNSLRR
ncbi:hypothetical protein HYU14_05445 [Candidatus Woesearchaeota archaeon]|nr:hypothetical protein [Candidatus Woesearchaeota archaeon]